MSAETTSETAEHRVSTLEEDSPKQSERDLPDIELPDDDPNEPTHSSSKNVLTNGLKRPLPDGVDGEKKKFTLTEISDDKLEVTNKDDCGKYLENTSDDESNVSNKTHDGIDQEFELIVSDNGPDNSSSDFTEDINGIRKLSKESAQQLLKLFGMEELTYDQFNSTFTQKMIDEMIKYKGYLNEIQLLEKKIKFWQLKHCLLSRQIETMKAFVVNDYKREIKVNEYAISHISTRSVGLQVCPKKEGSGKLPKQAIPFPTPDPVSINVEDDDDVVILEFETVDSAGSSTSKNTNMTTKKQMPPLVTTSRTLVVSPKNVTASPMTVTAGKSLNPIYIGTTPTTIDLTGNDDVIDESNIINLDDSISPIKVPRRIAASLLPASGNLGKTITYSELSKNLLSSSLSYIKGTASCSPQQTIALKKDTINTSPKSKNLKPILIEVSRTLQPLSTASYTPRKMTVSQLSASLKTSTPSYTTCQISASPGTSYTTCRVPTSLRAIHHTGSQSTSKPKPPEIPLLRHPSPVPGIPNQKNLPTWKRLPLAPNLTVRKSPERQNTPQALLLSWNMNVNKTIAKVIRYQIYAYQETPDQPPNIKLWKKIGDVNALPLPMCCSLTHFSNGAKYHFLVRAVDVYNRVGPFSNPESIYLKLI